MSYEAEPADESQRSIEARALYARFHGFAPQRLDRHPCKRLIPPVLTGLGELRGVIYSSDRGQPGRPRNFVHTFEKPPLLASDPSGRRLYVIGGSYRVTRLGIEG